jgi:hypothetical protein
VSDGTETYPETLKEKSHILRMNKQSDGRILDP